MAKKPVLFITFIKVDQTRRVFETIRAYQPSQLFIAQDGPRTERPSDADRIAQVREITAQIDWPCQVMLRQSDVNQGVRIGIENAITWFFENVTEGIILEDDTVPSPNFFTFCEQLLEKYRTDLRVFMIGGTNLNYNSKIEASYFFTEVPVNWGWATWATRWQYYEASLATIDKAVADGSMNLYYPDPYQREHEIERIHLLKKEIIPAWDYRWAYTLKNQNGLCIVPEKNMVSNIGFGLEATNTFDPDHHHAALYVENMEFPLRHPSVLLRSYIWEEQYFFPGQQTHRFMGVREIAMLLWRKFMQRVN